jgi:hypothetical protein
VNTPDIALLLRSLRHRKQKRGADVCAGDKAVTKEPAAAWPLLSDWSSLDDVDSAPQGFSLRVGAATRRTRSVSRSGLASIPLRRASWRSQLAGYQQMHGIGEQEVFCSRGRKSSRSWKQVHA